MQMKALRSLNLAKLSSSNSTSDEYWGTSMSAGTPAGYCLSQMRSMVFPLLIQGLIGSDEIRTEALIFVLTRFLPANRYPLRSKTLWFPFVGPGRLVLGSIEQCGSRWQAAARYRRIGRLKRPVSPGESRRRGARRRGGFLIRG